MTIPHRYVGGAIDLSQFEQPRSASASVPSPSVGGQVSVVATVTEELFNTEIVERSTQAVVIVMVGSDRSPVSTQLRDDLTTLAEEQDQPAFVLRYVDADSQPQLAQGLGIRALPSVLALALGQPIDQFEGGQPIAALRQWVATLLRATEGRLIGLPAGEQEDAPDPRYAQAQQLVAAGDFAGASALYDAMIAEGVTSPDIAQARAFAHAGMRLATEEAGTLRDADELFVSGQVDAAFDLLVAAVRTAGAEKEAAKQRLIELFGALAPDDPRVRRARTELASALY